MTAKLTPELLTEIAAQPPSAWARALSVRLPDDAGAQKQALLWLHTERASAAEEPERTPSLGPGNARYSLQQRLDGGATAAVWLARDKKLNRDVAIKVFHADRSAAFGSLAEILAEARAASDVISDHVVRILDVHDAEPPYLVMELVGEHEPRRGTLATGSSADACRPRDTAEAVRWVRDLAYGVRDAHLRNIFHRDLKPHNVLITPISRRAKIADFGLAVSSASAAIGESSGLVVTGASGPARIAGTPEYMAPEQARGLPIALDPRDVVERAILVGVDVWGLGAIAHGLLGNAPPWRAKQGLEPWELAASGAEPEPLPASVPARLRKIVSRALALRAEDRYADAGELAAELDAYLAARPTSFDRAPTARLGLWMRRNPQLTATAVVATFLAGISLAAYLTVVRMREQSAALADEMHRVESDRNDLAADAERRRAELAETEKVAAAKSAELAEVQRTLAEANKDYQAIVSAKDEELRTSSAATRTLAAEVDSARANRDTAEKGRELYESFWTRARGEADRANRDRDTAREERDRAREERDQAAEERDAAKTSLAAANEERDAAGTERDREVSRRRALEAELAKVAGDLASLKITRLRTEAAGAPGTAGAKKSAAKAAISATSLSSAAAAAKAATANAPTTDKPDGHPHDGAAKPDGEHERAHDSAHEPETRPPPPRTPAPDPDEATAP